MFYRRFRQGIEKLAVPLQGLALAFLILGVAGCDPKVNATEAPAPATAEALAAKSQPTAVPEPTATPSEARVAQPDSGAMAFADYWNPPTDFYGEPVYGGNLRINYEDPLEYANIWGAAFGAAAAYRVPTGATLVMENRYDAYAPVIPDLARNWAIHESLEGVTFQFREGTTWHNGESFTCEDARYSFETMITGNGITASYMQHLLTNVVMEQMSCLNDTSLEVKFQDPTAIPLHAFSHPYALIFNKAWFHYGGEDAMFEDVSIGLGPFTWREGQSVGIDAQYFEKNSDYFIPDLPYVDGLVIYGILDYSTQLATQLAHQTDWHWVRNWDQYQAYVDHEQILTVIRPTRNNFRLWINTRRPPFDNAKVRQAIVMGIDRIAAIQVLEDGHGAVGGFGYAPGSPWELTQRQLCSVPGWCVSEDMKGTRTEAIAILEEEGFDFGKTYLFTLGYDPPAHDRATFLQEHLRLLGIETDFNVPCDPFPRSGRCGWDDFLPDNSFVASDDPNTGVSSLLQCDVIYDYWTPGSPCDENIFVLLDRAEVEPDPGKRLELAHQIELAAMRQYSSFPLYWEQEAAAFGLTCGDMLTSRVPSAPSASSCTCGSTVPTGTTTSTRVRSTACLVAIRAEVSLRQFSPASGRKGVLYYALYSDIPLPCCCSGLPGGLHV